MKTIIMKCSLLLMLLVPFLAFAGTKGEEVEKRINREFNTLADGYLAIDNRYGNIDIAIGESNKIKIEVIIKVEAGSIKKAQERLDMIDVKFDESRNRVTAVTQIESSSGFMSWFQTGSVDLEVNYNVLVPADIYMELVNKYGGIYVENTNRDLRIDLSYGDIRLGDINAKLSLKMAYSDGTLSKIRNGDFVLSYSDLEMEDAESVDIDMKYTDLVMGSAIRANIVTAYSDFRGIDIDDITYRGKYDDVVIDRVKSIDMESAYSGMKIGGLSTFGHFDMRYGDLSVKNISAGFSKLNVNTSYTGVVLRFSPESAFTIDAENNYCEIHHRNLRVSEDIQRSGSSTLKASKGNGGGQVLVRMNYGELSIE